MPLVDVQRSETVGFDCCVQVCGCFWGRGLSASSCCHARIVLHHPHEQTNKVSQLPRIVLPPSPVLLIHFSPLWGLNSLKILKLYLCPSSTSPHNSPQMQRLLRESRRFPTLLNPNLFAVFISLDCPQQHLTQEITPSGMEHLVSGKTDSSTSLALSSLQTSTSPPPIRPRAQPFDLHLSTYFSLIFSLTLPKVYFQLVPLSWTSVI